MFMNESEHDKVIVKNQQIKNILVEKATTKFRYNYECLFGKQGR